MMTADLQKIQAKGCPLPSVKNIFYILAYTRELCQLLFCFFDFLTFFMKYTILFTPFPYPKIRIANCFFKNVLTKEAFCCIIYKI